MYLLALDCSTSRGSVAVARTVAGEPPVICCERAFAAGRGCGGKLFAALQEALDVIRKKREVDKPEVALQGIIVGLGPGSYSGVRQAIAAASGLAAATGTWLHGTPSGLLLGGGATAGFQVVGDARRGAYYYTAVGPDGDCLEGPELLDDAVTLETRLAARPDWPVRVVEVALPGGLLPAAKIELPDAARSFFLPPSALRSTPLEPIYLRPVSITLPKAILAAS